MVECIGLYIFLSHQAREQLEELEKKVIEDHDPAASAQLIALYEADQQSDYHLKKALLSPELMTAQDRSDLQAYPQVYTYQQQQEYRTATAKQLLKSLLTEGPTYRSYANYYAASDEAKKYEATVNQENSDSLLASVAWLRGKASDEEIYDKQSSTSLSITIPRVRQILTNPRSSFWAVYRVAQFVLKWNLRCSYS